LVNGWLFDDGAHMADYEAMAALKRLFVLIYIHRLRTDFGVYAEMNEVMVYYTRNIFR
jgi:hypothetical protein